MQEKKKMLSMQKKESLYSYFYILPGGLVMLIFVAIPMIMSVYMSVFKIKSFYGTWTFNGFHNYVNVLGDGRFWMSLLRTVGYGSFGLVIGFGFGLMWSFMIARHKMLNFYRYIFYIPSIVSSITMARLWNYMFTPNEFGLINSLMMSLNVIDSPLNWLSEDMLPAVVLITNFYGAGGGMTLILFTTAINNIDQSIIEATKIDGASTMQRIWFVELPQIKPVIMSYLTLSVIGSFKSFEGLYGLSANSEATETIAVYLYKNVQNSSMGYGYASTIGCVNTIIILLLVQIFNLFVKKKEEV